MPVIPEGRKEGVYTAKYLGCTEKMFDVEETGEQELRYIWRFQDVADPTTVGEISKVTGTSFKSANSNAHKMARGILGKPPEAGDDTESRVGQLYNVVWGPNQAGNLTITNVIPLAGAATVAAAPAPGSSLPSSGPTPDELPF